jgi:hypothetical protein
MGPGRKLTVILYLNPPGWASGGALRVCSTAAKDAKEGDDADAETTTTMGEDVMDIAPLGDTLVFLRSDLPHEVLPCYDARAALTIWYDGKLLPAHPLIRAAEAAAAAASGGVRRGGRPARPAEEGEEGGGVGVTEEDEGAALAPLHGGGGKAPARRRRRWWWFS